MLSWLFTASILCASLFAQQHTADSLILVVNTQKNDTHKVKSLLNLGAFYNLIKPDTALKLAVEALELAKSLDYKRGIENSLHRVGMGYHVLPDYPKALHFYFLAMGIAEKNNDHANIALLCNLIGHVYLQQENYEEALRYMHKGMALDERLDLMAHTCEVFVQMKNADSARFYGQRTLDIASRDKHPRFMGFALFELGYANLVAQEYSLALEYFRVGISLTIKAGNDYYGLTKEYRGIAQVFEKMQIKDSSIHYARLAVDVAIQHNMLHEAMKASDLLASFYRARQNADSTLFYMDLSKKLSDSLFSQHNRSQLLSLTIDEKLRQIDRQETYKKEAEERNQNLQIAAIALALLSLIIGFMIFSQSIIAKPKVIKWLGLISLLLVFEFINLVLHPYLTTITGHSPILMLLIMVGIAAILLPLHHKLEHWVSGKLVEKNKKIRLVAAKKTIEELKELN